MDKTSGMEPWMMERAYLVQRVVCASKFTLVEVVVSEAAPGDELSILEGLLDDEEEDGGPGSLRGELTHVR
jgi:hypothetical protein